MLKLHRVYDRHGAGEGRRYLVERLWPRGVKKTALKIDGWLKDVAPSPELRKWFSHDPDKWSEFRRRYFAELDKSPDAWKPLADAARHGDVVLEYSSRDEEHNNAVALRDYLSKHLPKR
jgi:uncharacterized protein YeaO (DUF488 family)